MIGWGAGPCYMILQEDGFLQMIGWSRCPMIDSSMINRYAGTQREREPVHDCVDQPWWSPESLTKSQKRRVQRLRQTKLLEKGREEALRKKGVKSQV